MNRRTRPAVATALLLPALALTGCGGPWWSGDPAAADSTPAGSSSSGATPSGTPGAGASPAGAAPVSGAPTSAASPPTGAGSQGSTSAGPVSPAPSGRASAPAGTPSSPSPAAPVPASPPASVPAASVPAAGEPAPCSAPDLEIAVVDTGGSADAGGVSRQLTVANPGADCTISGFPVITYQSAPGKIVGAPAGHFGEPGPATILGSGQMTTVALREQQAGKYGPDCRATDVPLLAVALADGGATAYLDRPATACASTAFELLQTGPYDS